MSTISVRWQTDLADKLGGPNDKAQQYREQVIERDAAIRQLITQNELLTEQISGKVTESVEPAVPLEEEIAQGKALRKEFEAYKDEHKISDAWGRRCWRTKNSARITKSNLGAFAGIWVKAILQIDVL